jgi:hypothetical protein
MANYRSDPEIEELARSHYEELAISALETQRLLQKAANLICWYDYYKQTGRPISDDLSDDLCDFASTLLKFGYGC